eukprot:5324249-Prymnesium_polylepis.2
MDQSSPGTGSISGWINPHPPAGSIQLPGMRTSKVRYQITKKHATAVSAPSCKYHARRNTATPHRATGRVPQMQNSTCSPAMCHGRLTRPVLRWAPPRPACPRHRPGTRNPS